MCWVKSGKDIKNQEDLRNLITGVILRQPGNYQKGKIKQIVNSYLRGSSYTLDDRSLSQLIDDGLGSGSEEPRQLYCREESDHQKGYKRLFSFYLQRQVVLSILPPSYLKP